MSQGVMASGAIGMSSVWAAARDAAPAHPPDRACVHRNVRSRWARCVRRSCLILCVLFAEWSGAGLRPARAQVYQMTAGASNVSGAQGGSLQLFGSNYQTRLDVGYLGQPRLGADVQL